MKDPRQTISRETYSRGMTVILVLLALWILLGVWFELPSVFDKIAATICIVVGVVVLTWPVKPSP